MKKEKIEEILVDSGMMRIFDEHASEYGNGTYALTDYPELEKFIALLIYALGAELAGSLK